jgi:hypothetical protein|nr:MAG TPA: hypothetical protein [Caudoviricetes sp.]
MYNRDELIKIGISEIVSYTDYRGLVIVEFKCMDKISPDNLQNVLQYVKEITKGEPCNEIYVNANILIDRN